MGGGTGAFPIRIIAQWRGDYAQAEQHYQTALTINKELDHRAGIGGSYQQLGRIAELRADYAQAERHYQVALNISKKLGDQTGIATCYHQLGELRTEQGRPAEGIPYTVLALAIHLELETPEASTDIFWLAGQRQEVGEESFTEILGGLLNAGSVQFVIEAINTMEQRPGATGT